MSLITTLDFEVPKLDHSCCERHRSIWRVRHPILSLNSLSLFSSRKCARRGNWKGCRTGWSVVRKAAHAEVPSMPQALIPLARKDEELQGGILGNSLGYAKQI